MPSLASPPSRTMGGSGRFAFWCARGRTALPLVSWPAASKCRPTRSSSNLAILSHAGLIESRRAGKSVIYSVRYPHMTALLQFLMEDCCAGSSEICAPLRDLALVCDCVET